MWKVINSKIFFTLAFLTTNIESVEESDVSYYLFTKHNASRHFLLNKKNVNVLEKGAQIIFLIHGWEGNHEKEWYETLKNNLLQINDKNNVIEVDWSGPAHEWYGKAAINTKEVGNIIGKFIGTINEDQQIPLDNFHVIGHSLGGHVAGYAGKTVFSLISKKISRITALDPAGPFFEGFLISDENRLHKTDADSVVVYHTDGGKFGYLNSLGTVDIYFNGGRALQPGCPAESGGINPMFCSHVRSIKYFIEALNNDNFWARKCHNNWAFTRGSCLKNGKIQIGREILSTQAGDYYVETNSESPYCCKELK